MDSHLDSGFCIFLWAGIVTLGGAVLVNLSFEPVFCPSLKVEPPLSNASRLFSPSDLRECSLSAPIVSINIEDLCLHVVRHLDFSPDYPFSCLTAGGGALTGMSPP